MIMGQHKLGPLGVTHKARLRLTRWPENDREQKQGLHACVKGSVSSFELVKYLQLVTSQALPLPG